MCSPSTGHKKSTMSNQTPDPTPNFSKMGLCSSVRLQIGNLSGKRASLPMAEKKSSMSSQAPDPTPNFFKMVLCSSGRVQVANPEWKMCFPSPGHRKTTISSQAPDPTPNFFKIVLRSSVRVQVGNLSGKCASLPRAVKNQQCPIRLLTLPPTFPKWFFAVLLGFRLAT